MRRVPKHVGLLYVVLVGAFLAWYIARGHKVDVLVTMVSAFTALLALPAAVVAVLRSGKTGPAPARPGDMADQLAQGVRQQWEAEARLRRLNDPFPLPVAWEAADADLVESWTHLTELAEDWPGQSPQADSAWALSPAGLAGKGGDIIQVFECVPTRRLVVLGEPGAGKTMLLIRLLLALLEHRLPGGPVPVLFTLASWDPARQDLYAWMAEQLTQDHPALRAPTLSDPSQTSAGTQARVLLQQRLILPILDGLDELPESLQARALHAINQALPARQPLVLSSRTAEYRSTLTTAAAVTVLLNGAAGIHLLPLDPVKAAAYLERDAGGPDTKAAARWRRVTAALGTTAPVSQALSTPLGLFLARTIYNPRPDEHLSGLPNLSDPDELLDQARFPTRQDIDTHLFTAFIPAAYRPHPDQPTSWSTQQAQRTLTFLAHHLQHTLHGTPNLAWWQLPRALPKRRRVLTIGLIAGLMSGLLACIAVGLLSLESQELTLESVFTFVVLAGLAYGFICAVAVALVGWLSRTDQPSSQIRWSWRGRSWLTFGLVPGLVFGAALGIPGSDYGLKHGVVVALSAGLPFVLLGGLRSVHPDLAKAVRPSAILAQDRRTYSVITVTGGLVGVLALSLVQAFEIWSGLAWKGVVSLVLWLPFGLALGFPIGFILGLARSVWLEYLVTRIRLAARGRVPWRFMSFLADAHERRGVLRQAGAVYQFRHLDLQRYLAQRQP
ncbi:NACHT domain-containing protein [Streptomyces sp. NPDC086549]|uniref:NACHT domain-containing protein n=1 Tax=Streptomyces sp. NPDC086549 TaxID=3365752 RepID=UPI003800F26A